VQTIAESLRLPCAYTSKVIYNLYNSGLVEAVSTPTKSPTQTMPAGFFDLLVSELTDAIGPMATIIAHDQIASLGECTDAFPKARLEELIGLISNEICCWKRFFKDSSKMVGELQPFKAL